MIRRIYKIHQKLLCTELPEVVGNNLMACKCFIQSPSRNHIPTFPKLNVLSRKTGNAILCPKKLVSGRMLPVFIQTRIFRDVLSQYRVFDGVIHAPVEVFFKIPQLPREIS